MEPRIQYAKTSDGVRIAYWTMGEGPPLVWMPPLMMSHTRMELQRPSARSFYDRLSQHRKLVRYDCRASGLSDRTVSDYSVKGLLLDLEAVVDRLGLESFNLLAPARSMLIALTYAARYPERVSRLILWNPSPSTSPLASSPLTARQQAMRNLRDQDWELYTQLSGLLRHGWSQAEEGRWAAEGGEILVADTVRGLCSGKGFLFADRGEFIAKGIEERVRISEVRWREG